MWYSHIWKFLEKSHWDKKTITPTYSPYNTINDHTHLHIFTQFTYTIPVEITIANPSASYRPTPQPKKIKMNMNTSRYQPHNHTFIPFFSLCILYIQVSWWRTCEPFERHVAYSDNIFKCWLWRYCSEHVLWPWNSRDNRNYGKCVENVLLWGSQACQHWTQRCDL